MVSEGRDVHIEFLTDRGLIAVQGPGMASALQPLTDIDLSNLTFMTSRIGTVAGVENCRVTRCGYTGEDGVEISVDDQHCQKVTEALLETGEVALAGLGARDSLRLEAGLCLYGNDIDESTSPVEAGLAWTIPKARRTIGGYPGADIILKHLSEGVKRKRVGFISGGPPARGHADIENTDGVKIGEITSGCPSPTLGKGVNVSMGYVDKKFAKIGTKLDLVVRNKKVQATVTKMPFVKSNYYTRKN